ncbi:hypothetical protein TNCV_3124431 [Trichonephila clavipes]|nr:hypothetical protein TNCV_3124431 [Trichonephila clavipes]
MLRYSAKSGNRFPICLNTIIRSFSHESTCAAHIGRSRQSGASFEQKSLGSLHTWSSGMSCLALLQALENHALIYAG